jgi:hypothetical protein
VSAGASGVGAQQPVAAEGAAGDEAGLVEADHLAVQRGERHSQAGGEVAHSELLIGVQHQPHQQLGLVLRSEHRKQAGPSLRITERHLPFIASIKGGRLTTIPSPHPASGEFGTHCQLTPPATIPDQLGRLVP